MNIVSFLRGKKTYLTAAGWVAWGLWNIVVEGDTVSGGQRILEGISLVTLRAGVAKAVTR